MIVSYRFKNFKSFKDEQVFYMTPVKGQKDLEQNIVTLDKKYKELKNSDNKLLKVAAINGQNASGKSNFVDSLRFMKNCVLSSHIDKRELDKIHYFGMNNLDQFMYNEKGVSSLFEVTFLNEENIYVYGFILNEEEILEEYLKKNNVVYYERKKNKIRVGEENNIEEGFVKMAEKSLAQKKSTLALSLFIFNYGMAGKDNSLEKLHFFFNNYLTVVTKDNLNSQLNYLYKGIEAGENGAIQVFQLIKSFMKSLDVRIIDIELSEEKNQEYPFISVHEKRFEDGSKKIIKLPFSKESEGTKKLIKTSFSIISSLLIEKSVLVVDELDDKIHTNLFIEIIKLFQKSKSQFIFATHNPYILEHNLLRRDQIYFVDKNEYEESELYSLSDFKGVRKTDSYQKRYLNGNYGAVPIIDFSKLEKALGFDNNGKK